MRQALRMLVVFLALALTVSLPFVDRGFAQAPTVSVYFSVDGEWALDVCPYDPLGMLFIIAKDVPSPFVQLEYRADLPPDVIYLGEQPNGGSAVGNIVEGVIQTWPGPQDASSQLVVNVIHVLFTCQDCIRIDVPICLNSHPGTGYFRAVGWPDGSNIYPATDSAVICPSLCGVPGPTGRSPLCGGRPECPISPPVPVSRATWGAVKALYR